MTAGEPCIVLTTVGLDVNARSIARNLVERRLVACVNVVERVHSIYRWEGRVSEDGEVLLVMKTTTARLDELKDALFAVHPYAVPEFVVLPVTSVEGPYREWLLQSVM